MSLTTKPATRPQLRRGSRGQAVGYAQNLLNTALGFHPPLTPIVVADEDYGGITVDAVSLFQYRQGLPITGQISAVEWRALELFNWPAFLRFACTAAAPQAQLAVVARPYLGARETGENRMGTDEQMKEIFKADDLAPGGKTDGYAWCAAFVSLCVQKLVAKNPMLYSGVTAPREAAVSKFLNNWATHEKCLVFSPKSKVIKPEIGDIVVFTFSHIGIAETINDSAINTIEGNTNDKGGREGIEVAQKRRSLSVIRRFIRLPVSQTCLPILSLQR